MNNFQRSFGFGTLPVVVKNLIIINVIVFIGSLIILSKNEYLYNLLIVHYFQSDLFRPHQLVTAMFMHASFGHLLGNMLGLWVFGSMLENVWGPKKFLIFYMVCGLGANVCDQIYLFLKYYSEISVLQQQLEGARGLMESEMILTRLMELKRDAFSYASLGASGAVYGLIMGAALLFPNTELYLYFMIPIKLKYLAIIYGAIEVFAAMSSGGSGDNIAHLVHLGGMLFGFILIMIWRRDRRNFY
ncbi:MAG: rhomboid family intramembrane serine protease [Bacteroidota bacterium]